MKISKAEKEKNYRKIVNAAVQVISQQGFRAATMKDIAKAAEIADATIYKYFPTKESILHTYFELKLEDLIERLKAIPDFHQYSFQEQMHCLLETQLELFAPDRAFVKLAYENVFLTNWISAMEGSKDTKERFFEVIEDLIQSAVEAEEFIEPPLKTFCYELFWDHALGITYYWLKDETEKFTNTTQLIDKSLSLTTACLKSGILSRAMDLVHFLLREHVFSKMKKFNSKPDRSFTQPKKKFMARAQEGEDV